jgi:protein-L-isoaspartate(D-aspartate) O-methyltransferase
VALDNRHQLAFAEKRAGMLERQLRARGIADPRVLAAMGDTAREEFVPRQLRQYAYYDQPLSIGKSQTISQPYIVALMAERAEIKPTDRVLEIGTGSGYSAAVLSRLGSEVYTVERHASLAAAAARRLLRLGYTNVHVQCDNGWLGWQEHAPYDAIVVTAGATEVPSALLEQLAVGGRLLIPVGPSRDHQRLLLIRRASESEYREENLGFVAFVPFVNDEAV